MLVWSEKILVCVCDCEYLFKGNKSRDFLSLGKVKCGNKKLGTLIVMDAWERYMCGMGKKLLNLFFITMLIIIGIIHS